MPRSGRRIVASLFPFRKKRSAANAAAADMPSGTAIRHLRDFLSRAGPIRSEETSCGRNPISVARRSIVPVPYSYTRVQIIANWRTEEPKSEND